MSDLESPNAPEIEGFSQSFDYWAAKQKEDWHDNIGWEPIYTNKLPPKHSLLREERLPQKGDYGAVDQNNNITCRVHALRFVMMMMVYLQLDRPKYYDVLVIDVDCDFDLSVLKGTGIPMPRYFVSRRRQPGDTATYVRRPHLVYWLRRPVLRRKDGKTTEAARYYEAIWKTLKERLKDLGLNIDDARTDISKNPHNDAWDTVQGDYRDWSLQELHHHLGNLVTNSRSKPKPKPEPLQNSEQAPIDNVLEAPPVGLPAKEQRAECRIEDQSLLEGYAGRNEYIFHETRLAAYPMKRKVPDPIVLYGWIHSHAHSLNSDQFGSHTEGPLVPKVIDTIVKSIFDFVQNKYNENEYAGLGEAKDRGVCRRKNLIQPGMTKKMKQGVGGSYGASKNAEKTRTAVHEARDRLIEAGAKVTHSAIAREANVSRTTVRKWLAETATITVTPATQKVVNTVPIRKIDPINLPTVPWAEAERAHRVRMSASAHAVISLKKAEIKSIDVSDSGNSPYQPIRTKEAWNLATLFRHPSDSSMVLTSCGDSLNPNDTRVVNRPVEAATTDVLDRAGYYDDPEDEYAPPIGEQDSNGVVWYPEEFYAAPDAKPSKTYSTNWEDADVDRYLESLSA